MNFDSDPAVVSDSIGPYTFDEFIEAARLFHGYPAPGLILGGYMVEEAKRYLPEGCLFDAISETSWCLPDAVQMLTLCSIGNGWLKVVNLGLYALSLFDKYTGEGVRIYLDVDKLGDYPEIRTWYMKEKPKSEQDSARLREEIRQARASICSVEHVTIKPKFLEKRSKGGIAICPICGEAYPASFGGICRSCQGESPYIMRDGDCWRGSVPEGPALRPIPVEQAAGKRALHDMTRIVPGVSKGAEFKAGQELSVGDVCRLQQMGRFNVYVEEGDLPGDDWVHEDDAARAFGQAMAGEGVRVAGEPREGKVNFEAGHGGLFLVDEENLERFNLVPDVMCATRHSHSVVREGGRLAGSRAIPLYLSRENFSKAMTVLENGPLFRVEPLKKASVGILVTGNEVFQGLIEDKFEPIITSKVEALGSGVVKTIIVPDERERISGGVNELLAAGANLIITTAGLSVDPDDVTRQGLIDAGVTDMIYGAPILPGAMTLLAKVGAVDVLGVPACALYYKTTSLDLILPRLLAGVEITRRDIARLGHGAFCLECRSCTFPKCPFGK